MTGTSYPLPILRSQIESRHRHSYSAEGFGVTLAHSAEDFLARALACYLSAGIPMIDLRQHFNNPI